MTPASPALSEGRIRQECVDILYKQIPNSFVAAMVVTLYIIGSMWSRAPHALVGLWLGIQALAQVHRFTVYFAFRRGQLTIDNAARWAWRYAAYMLVAGIVWGLTPFFFFREADPLAQALTMCGLYGIAAGSVPGNAYFPPATYAFVWTIFGAVMVRLLLIGGSGHIVLGLASLGFAGVMTLFCRVQYRSIVDGIRIRFENLELVTQLRDQTAAAEAARQHAEHASLAKSQFLAAASHDLRQPLHALGLFSASLQGLQLDDKARQVVERIHQNIDALERLFDELLDISRLDAGVVEVKAEPVPVSALWQSVVAQHEALAENKGLALVFRGCDVGVMADVALSQRVLGNLVANAIRYTASGRVVVTARRAAAGRVRLEVRDTGIGIALEDHLRIFDEFVQVANPERDRRKGLGLGLSIAQRTAALLGTRVQLRSRPGQGSVFSFELPLCRPGQTPVLPATMPAPSTTDLVQGKTVLLIDDEATIREGLDALLGQWGCHVICAADLEQALAQLDAAAPPHLVLADLRLRNGASGIDAIACLRERIAGDWAACLITGETDARQLVAARTSGLTILHKPVRAAPLRATMNHLLRT